MTHLKVAVRIRPFSQREKLTKATKVVQVENNTVSVTNLKVPEENTGDSRERTRRFTFDYCFHGGSSQNDIFEALSKEIKEAIERRYHSCVLAYGQSSSGKTHTMMGTLGDPGLTPRLCQEIFTYLRSYSFTDESNQVETLVSYLEIYNEKVNDLLIPNEEPIGLFKRPNLRVREHPKKGPYVQGLTQRRAADPESLRKWLEIGNANRKVSSTLINPHSSRSHSVFTIAFGEGVQLHLVDLAGSERCHNISTLKEGANINKSLVALGNVISTLADHCSKSWKTSRKRFVPYRDSTLTWLLKDTLGGNSRTLMIATISPSSSSYNESVNTLRFGQRAKKIISRPVVNDDPKERLIRELRAEISRLKDLLVSQEFSKIPHNIEHLLPIMEVSSVVSPKIKNVPPIRRTSSEETEQIDLKYKRPYSSTETITNKPKEVPKRLSQPSLLPRRSIEKSTIPKTANKGIVTEEKGPKKKSIIPKPRSAIVAAVTNRLYATTKKKEASTETSNFKGSNEDIHKELMICSNARLRLQELTHRALKAHKRRHVETQTDSGPVLRVKEVSTDVDGLKLSSNEIRDVHTSTKDVVKTRDAGTMFGGYHSQKACPLLFTRTCGTQSTIEAAEAEKRTPSTSQPPSSISFTKYLRAMNEPSVQIVNPCTSNPIYTNTVNINVSHNYINRKQISEAISDDSLEDNNLPTMFSFPDIISNHNSLEPSTFQEKKAHLNDLNYITPQIYQIPVITSLICKAELRKIPLLDSVDLITFQVLHAPQIITTTSKEHCKAFEDSPGEKQYAQMYTTEDLIVPRSEKVTVLKSIIKTNPNRNDDPNSLFNAISNFMEEATSLMSNLKVAASKMQEERCYDVEVTLKEVKGLDFMKETLSTDYQIPVNKYEVLLKGSCERLEECLDKIKKDPPCCKKFHDKSEDLNLDTSDYGSLPRRKYTPSEYLRHLATVRRHVVESTRSSLAGSQN